MVVVIQRNNSIITHYYFQFSLFIFFYLRKFAFDEFKYSISPVNTFIFCRYVTNCFFSIYF